LLKSSFEHNERTGCAMIKKADSDNFNLRAKQGFI
jgi:hypothetical protein